MSVNDKLGMRMKTYYEQIPSLQLMRRTPVAIRIDGRAFHTFTHGFQRPFDDCLISTMQATMKFLCENIQGCILGYTQSDEITLILQDYATLTTAAWFDYKVQKICSIAASMATMTFNKYFVYEFEEFHRWVSEGNPTEEEKRLDEVYYTAMMKCAMFDARCFNIPREEVTNLIYWRQLDATRNSIQMVAQANFSHNQLQGLSCNELQDKLMVEKGINWNDLDTQYKRGSCCIKDESGWKIDNNIPVFSGDGRNYIENILKEYDIR